MIRIEVFTSFFALLLLVACHNPLQEGEYEFGKHNRVALTFNGDSLTIGKNSCYLSHDHLIRDESDSSVFKGRNYLIKRQNGVVNVYDAKTSQLICCNGRNSRNYEVVSQQQEGQLIKARDKILFGLDSALYVGSGQSIQHDSTAGPIVVVNYFESLEKKFKGCIAISANDNMRIFTNIKREAIRCSGLDTKDTLFVYFTDDQGSHYRLDTRELASAGFAAEEPIDKKSFLRGDIVLTLSPNEIDTIHYRRPEFPFKFKKIGG